MFHSDEDYADGRRRYQEESLAMSLIEAKLKRMRWSAGEIAATLKERAASQARLARDLATYERLRAGDVSAVPHDHGLGQTLIAMRIALGMSQKELAEALGQPLAQIERDEQNEYRGLSVRTARQMMAALRDIEAKAMRVRDAGASAASRMHDGAAGAVASRMHEGAATRRIATGVPRIVRTHIPPTALNGSGRTRPYRGSPTAP